MKTPHSSLKLLIILIIFLYAGPSIAAPKSDLAKEKRWREQIEPSLMLGEPLNLKAADTEFLALFSENSAEKSLGGVILVHGIGVHPAWPDVIEPLRTGLTEHGWHTLSIQMPILANDIGADQYEALFDEAAERIQAAVDFYAKKGIKNIAIVSHSLGTTMTSYYLATQKKHKVNAFVAISFGPGKPGVDKLDSYKHLNQISIPLFDIFGSEDFPQNVNTATKRQTIARKTGNKGYQQVKIESANHFFSGMDDVLVKRVHGWLKKTAGR